jgi:hypothetical protein
VNAAGVVIILLNSSAQFIGWVAAERGVGPGLLIHDEEAGYVWLGAIAYDDYGEPVYSTRAQQGEVLNPLIGQSADEFDDVVGTLLDDEFLPAWLVGCDCGLCAWCLQRGSGSDRQA